MANLDMVLGDLAAEGEDLDGLVSSLAAEQWSTPTPAQGWDITRQIAHLAWTDHVALLSATDPDAFAEQVVIAWQNPTGFVDEAAAAGATAPPDELLDGWRIGRKALLEALRGYPGGEKLQWFGPPMSVTSMATARIMETWAHGQDIADALGVTRLPTARLKHVAHIGIRARDFAYTVHEQAPPGEQFRIELTAPDGALWTWGPDGAAAQSVTGPALDFCLLVTRRRHRDDLALTATGADATHWLTIAQAFAGGAGTGREKGQFA